MTPAGFEPTVPASELPQNRAATGTGNDQGCWVGNYVYVSIKFNTSDFNFRK